MNSNHSTYVILHTPISKSYSSVPIIFNSLNPTVKLKMGVLYLSSHVILPKIIYDYV